MSLTNTVTKGGSWGHWFRRFLHINTLWVPVLYYNAGPTMAGWFHLNLKGLLVILFVANVVVEAIRLQKGWLVVGHREHERRCISSFAWGFLGIAYVLAFAPGVGFAFPLIAGCALIDPLLGELRPRLARYWVFLVGSVASACIWWIASAIWGISWWWGVWLGPVTVWAEWTKLPFIDDNAMMLLVPLTLLLLLTMLH